MEALSNITLGQIVGQLTLWLAGCLGVAVLGFTGWFGWRYREMKRRVSMLETKVDEAKSSQIQVTFEPGAVYNNFKGAGGQYHLHFDGKGQIISPKPVRLKGIVTSQASVSAELEVHKADSQGKRKDMRWAHYFARDHEYGRPYVMTGIKFFTRLTKGVIRLSNQQWTWYPEFRQRWHRRNQYNIEKIVYARLVPQVIAVLSGTLHR